MLTKTVALEVVDKGISVNGIASGAIAADMNKDIFEDEQNRRKTESLCIELVNQKKWPRLQYFWHHRMPAASLEQPYRQRVALLYHPKRLICLVNLYNKCNNHV
jgi:NAD(P)-dependent dehydrogenase (short-subunit alcohol dehydrogenase family)